MEGENASGQYLNDGAMLNRERILKEFSPMLKNAHAIIEEVAILQFKARLSFIIVFILTYALVCIIMSDSLKMTIINLIILVPGILTGSYFMFTYMNKKDWTYPGGHEWFTGHFVKMYYWRAYLRNTQTDMFNLNSAVPNVVADMMVFMKDMNSILKERFNTVIAFFGGGILVTILQVIMLSYSSLDSYYIMLVFIFFAGGVMELVLWVQMKRSFSGLIKNLETYNRNVEDFWKRYW